MDGCSQSRHFWLSLWLRLQIDRIHKSLWQGKALGRDKGQSVMQCKDAQVLSAWSLWIYPLQVQ